MTPFSAKRFCLGMALLGGAGMAAAAGAAAGRGYTLTSQSTITNDSNFLLSGAGQEASDRIAMQTFGIKLQLPLSLQQLQLDYSLSASKHQHFVGFDYVANNFSATLQWAYTPRLTGSVYTTRASTLNAAQDSLNPGVRNANTTTSSGVRASYGLLGPWQLQAAVGRSKSVNEQALLGSGDSDSNTASAGVRYAPTPLLNVNYNLSQSTGTSQSADASGAITRSANHTTTHQLQLTWTVAASTSLTADMQRQASVYDDATAYNFSGVSGGLSVQHAFSPKTSVTASLRRNLASKQTAQSVYSQTQVLTVTPLWQASAKLGLSLPVSLSRVTDLGGAGTGQTDHFSDLKLVLSWQPRPFANFNASVQRAHRSSSVPLLDYSVQRTALDANLSF